ncbi:MAG TPA: H-X9-DG-CTERM domain-containing protein, partial [Planctomycetaceae bacterium]|nr:H-X9-DG-CTERM domain-containing protein [Planctomycetaceae bacterium]
CGCGVLVGVTIVAQAFWSESLSLFTGRDPIMHDEMGARDLIPRSISRSHLRHVANEATARLEEKFGALPAGGEFDELGTPLHSWCTALLSFQEAALHNQIRRDLPWDAPENRPAFETPVGLYLIRAFGDSRTSDGYAVSHYAANAHVLGPNTHLKVVSDGAAQTLLVGEASQNCRAWGDPRNWRDPALGINTSPEGFGTPWSLHGCQFVFVDGSVKFLSEKTDRALLHKLATPNGGEEIKPHELP